MIKLYEAHKKNTLFEIFIRWDKRIHVEYNDESKVFDDITEAQEFIKKEAG